ncbi:hypothetical protein [Echinicola vietnamensis]|uniref:Uncharacterized protein n=1 Tax=Echinicola vietnamensis (strain DSM 17526 / LMG 23754 / KMM 6221) TaxID=926556 RepID=L0G4S5_ECHVK|nr:hypothetical protein [Echinicola vietnamensis]AGA80522.1 hypothetical protein Echvi_4334 [Echinicola vietnamensis DSM 17526]
MPLTVGKPRVGNKFSRSTSRPSLDIFERVLLAKIAMGNKSGTTPETIDLSGNWEFQPKSLTTSFIDHFFGQAIVLVPGFKKTANK